MLRPRNAVILLGAPALVMLASTLGGGERHAGAELAAPTTAAPTTAAPPIAPTTSGLPLKGVPPTVSLPAESTTTLAGATTTVPPTTVSGAVTPPTPRRGGTRVADGRKSTGTELTLRGALTTTAITVTALVVAGFIYGRVRSMPPRRRPSTDMARVTE